MSGKKGIDAFTNPSSAKIEQQRKIMEKIKKSNDTFTNPSSAKIEQQIRIMEEIKKILLINGSLEKFSLRDQQDFPSSKPIVTILKNVWMKLLIRFM